MGIGKRSVCERIEIGWTYPERRRVTCPNDDPANDEAKQLVSGCEFSEGNHLRTCGTQSGPHCCSRLVEITGSLGYFAESAMMRLPLRKVIRRSGWSPWAALKMARASWALTARARTRSTASPPPSCHSSTRKGSSSVGGEGPSLFKTLSLLLLIRSSARCVA